MQSHVQSHCKVGVCYSSIQKIKWHQRSFLTVSKVLRCISVETRNDNKEEKLQCIGTEASSPISCECAICCVA